KRVCSDPRLRYRRLRSCAGPVSRRAACVRRAHADALSSRLRHPCLDEAGPREARQDSARSEESGEETAGQEVREEDASEAQGCMTMTFTLAILALVLAAILAGCVELYRIGEEERE